MEAVIFDGKEYIKAAVLAKRFRYTADYLGQLCRGKKVDARLVGRAWYINLDSLNHHRDKRYKGLKVKEMDSPVSSPVSIKKEALMKPSSHYLSRIDVEPILKKKTVSIFKAKNGAISELPVRYENDDYSLIPRVNKTAVSKSIRIDQAEAETVRVQKAEASFTDFKAEPLPEIFLKGTLKVAGLDEATEPILNDEDLKIQPEIKSELEFLQKKPVVVRVLKKPTIAQPIPVSRSTVPGVTMTNTTKPGIQLAAHEASVLAPHKEQMTKIAIKKPHYAAAIPRVSSVRPIKAPVRPAVIRPDLPQGVKIPTPAASPIPPASFTPQSVTKKSPKPVPVPTSSASWLLPLFTTVAAIVLGVCLLVVEVELVVTQESFHAKTSFDFSKLKDAKNFLSQHDFYTQLLR